MSESISFGYGGQAASLLLNKLNRHGILAGATGTGKTVTLKVLAEQFSQQGIPVFLSDIKGDLMSFAEANSASGLEERLQKTHYENYTPKEFPIEVWDVTGNEGLPLRMTISEMGPILLSRLLNLNETQAGILNIVFNVADEEQLLLIDIADLRAMLNYVGQHAKTLSQHYGTISARSIGVILRNLITLENQGANDFFGEPDLELDDLMKVNDQGLGVINILNAKHLFTQPNLYSTVLLAALSDLFDSLPEVGDLDKPKLVFFFDEAHLLFKDTPKVLVDRIELMMRLIRSKGVSVFLVTQNPIDIPDAIAGQIANRIQHNLRAFTPAQIKVIRSIADTFRQGDDANLVEEIQALKVGEAIVSTLLDDGSPSYADRVIIYPPQSKIGTIDDELLQSIIKNSSLQKKYGQAINRESAHEILLEQSKEHEAELLEKANEDLNKKEIDIQESQSDSIFESLEKSLQQSQRNTTKSKRRSDSSMDRFTKNLMGSVGREIGKSISRGITGMFKNR